jgi:hypothetical protein
MTSRQGSFGAGRTLSDISTKRGFLFMSGSLSIVRTTPFKLILALLLGGVSDRILTAQDAKDVLLTMIRDGQSPVRMTAADLAKLTRLQVKAIDHEQNAVTFEGVLLRDALQPLGLPFGKDLRGKALTLYLLIEAQDGYQVLFTLPELDALFTDKVVLLADRRDGKPLSDKEGPLRIVVPDEKRQARWIRQVKSIAALAAGASQDRKNP